MFLAQGAAQWEIWMGERAPESGDAARGVGRARTARKRPPQLATPMIEPDFKTFCRLAKQGNLVPVYETFTADLLTPVGAYLRLARQCALRLPAGERRGRREDRALHVRGRQSGRSLSLRQWRVRAGRREPRLLGAVESARFSAQSPGALPAGAAAGLAAAGCRRHRLLRLRHGAPVRAPAGPDAQRSEDGRRGDDVLSGPGGLRPRAPPRLDRAQRLHRRPGQPARQVSGRGARDPRDAQATGRAAATSGAQSRQRRRPLRVTSNFTRRQFLAAVRKSKEYIRAGDIFQVVLSQRFSAQTARRSV